MDSILLDLRYSFRTMRRSPAFVVLAVIALALGIGANSAIFSIVNAAILRPLPYKNPDQLVQLWMRFTGIGIPKDQNWVSAPEFMDLQNNSSFSGIAAISEDSANIRIGAEPERIDAAVVTPSFFSVLGVSAQVGRVFRTEEGRPGRDHELLLSDALWRRRFGADPSIAGRKLVINEQSYTIVGVLPRWFNYPRDAELWAPLSFTAEDVSSKNRGNHGMEVIARLRPGLSFEQAQADMAVLSHHIVQDHPEYPYKFYNFAIIMNHLIDEQVGDIRTALWVLMGAVGLVLLIACANVANLLLVRASGREREIAVRQALGVTRWRLTRQLLTESAVLGITGGLAGLALAWGAVRGLVALAATSFPRVTEAHIDLRVVAFTMLIALATGVLFGIAPAFHSSGQPTAEALREGSRGTAGMRSQRLRATLAAGELALSLTLLAGAGLLIRSFLRLQDVDAGFRPDGVLTMRVSLPEERYDKPEQTQAFYRALLDRVRNLPGVDAAGAITGVPLGGTGWSGTATVDSRAVAPRDASPEVDQRPVTTGYFEATGITLLRGRYFNEHDTPTSAPVAIVDETMAKTYWPGEDAIGKRIKGGGLPSKTPWKTIVGVVRHVRYRTLEMPSRTEFYWPYAQTPFPLDSMTLAIHTSADPHSLIASVEREVQALDPDQPVYRVRTMRELMSESIARRRLSMLLLAVFAGLALALAAVGVYGVISYSVAQRAHEVGVRIALGARTGDVLRLVLGQSLRITGAGVVAGFVGSIALTRSLTSLLFSVKASDPVTFAATAALLIAVAMIASLIPALRATTIDPVEALRQE